MIGIFIYVCINPAFLTLTLLPKLLPAHLCSPLILLPGTVLCKLVFKHEDDLAYIILQGACVDLDSAVTFKFFVKTLRNVFSGYPVTLIS